MAEYLLLSSTPFQGARQLSTPSPSATNFASAISSLDGNEKRYWENKFGLDKPSNTTSSSSQAVTIKAGSSSVVHQVNCDNTASNLNGNSALVIACGPRIQLYGTTPQSSLNKMLREDGSSSKNEKLIVNPDRQVSTHGHLAYCSAFRVDGQLVAIGTANGLRVAHVNSRATLASFTTAFGVRNTAWFRNGQEILAVCEDAVRIYRLSSNDEAIRTLRGHGDIIRCGTLWQSKNETLVVTGSYDHTIRLWDLTSENSDGTSSHDDGHCLSILQHDAPVEALVLLEQQPSLRDASAQSSVLERPWLVSAGGTKLSVWNLQTGACIHSYSTHHNKTITSLISFPRITINDQHSVQDVKPRLLTGGIDGYLGIHAWESSTGTLQPDIYGTRISNDGITALGGTNNGYRLAVGTVSGKVIVRQRPRHSISRKRAAEPRAGTYSFFMRGMNADASADDFVVFGGTDSAHKMRKLHDYDIALKQFRYGDALDDALVTRTPKIVMAVLEELGRRRGLTIALSNRDEDSLESILAFTARYINQPRFAPILIGVTHKLIDIYAAVAGQSDMIDELFAKLKNQVAFEIKTQRKLLWVSGMVEGLITTIIADQEEDASD